MLVELSFNIFLYSILGRCFATYSVTTGYLLTSFSHNCLAVKTPLLWLQNIIWQNVVAPCCLRSRTRCQWGYIWGMVLSCDLVSHFLTEIWDRRCWHQKSWHFLSHFQSENGSNSYRCSESEVFPSRLLLSHDRFLPRLLVKCGCADMRICGSWNGSGWKLMDF